MTSFSMDFGGQPKRLLDIAIAGDVDVAISDAILQEMERVLRTKFAGPGQIHCAP